MFSWRLYEVIRAFKLSEQLYEHVAETEKWRNLIHNEWQSDIENQMRKKLHQQTGKEQREEQSLKNDLVDRPLKHRNDYSAFYWGLNRIQLDLFQR